jgi:hypothetical protein
LGLFLFVLANKSASCSSNCDWRILS